MTVTLRLRNPACLDGLEDWAEVPWRHVAECEHVETVCVSCLETWSWDWEIKAIPEPVRLAVHQVLGELLDDEDDPLLDPNSPETAAVVAAIEAEAAAMSPIERAEAARQQAESFRRLAARRPGNGELDGLANVAAEVADRLEREAAATWRGERGGLLRGKATPFAAMEVPTLRAIVDLIDDRFDGAASADVIKRVGELMTDTLTGADHERLAKGITRWTDRVHFVRMALISRGDMVKGSPRGIWQITDQGRQRLAEEGDT